MFLASTSALSSRSSQILVFLPLKSFKLSESKFVQKSGFDSYFDVDEVDLVLAPYESFLVGPVPYFCFSQLSLQCFCI